MIWMTLPILWSAVVMLFLRVESSLRRGRAGNDLDDFLRDRRLADAVVGQRQVTDHLGRVLRGGLHGRHAGALFGGRGLQEDAIELELDVLRQDVVEDRFR